ncbi:MULTISPECIES: VWA domain-containing protein [unclassified Halorubrum]|jgi:predicted ribosomally synthesized peptide with SipW-like signal peptide|uniref:vWA domain-containing protein n=1 Tax=unclassified Halorubrum TaxID=2642239 RepID=UPI0010F99A9B|nr:MULTISPECIES: vWA domain-containing protein [unclassified Halorubrum]TKX42150.1 VWA domain-containing protein [Halorubrum sp. ARQ200]TKX49341.1 VWA domain-containing protein [Halorubrum sp. ASP121]
MSQDTNDTIGLSRRKVLAGLGAVGVASAGAGLGTTAYFNDTEAFEGNTLTAGELDLKLDYKSTYLGGPGRLEHVQSMGYPDAEDLGDGRYLLDQAPSPADMQAWEDLVQGEEFDFCSPEADEFLVNGDGIPVFTLDDVKPGDSGEVTISVHICDNPAFLYLAGELTENAENGQSEPEMEQEGEDTDGIGELADAIEVCVWYDEDCDNVYEPTGTGQQNELEVALVSDVSGSMGGGKIAALKTSATSFVDNLSSPDEAAAISFASSANVDQELTTDYQAVKDAIDAYNASGGTSIAAGVSAGENELLNGTNATMGASKVMIVLSDGQSNASAAIAAADAAKANGIRIFTIALGAGAATGLLEDIATSPDDAFVAPDAADLDTVYAEIAQVVLAGEQKIFEGSMADFFGTFLADGHALDGDRQEEGRQPYPGATTQCIGFEWTLPAEVENEVQTDSVEFDIGLYAEQSRHNDNPQVTFNGTEANSTSPGPAPNGTGNVSGQN